MSTALAKRSVGDWIFTGANTTVLVILSLVTLYPILHVIFGSISDPIKLIQHRGLLLGPVGFGLEAYREVWRNPTIGSGYLNTLFVVAVGTALNIVMSLLGAYFLSCKRVMFKGPILALIVFTMFFSGGLVPRYLAVRSVGLYNSLFALIIPVAINTYNMLILRTAIQGVPDSLSESAAMDGATHAQILFRVMTPLVTPTLAVLVLYYGVDHWNSWFDAMIFLQKRERFPLQLILREILILGDTESMTVNVQAEERLWLSETIKYATIVVATVPILILYPSLQRYFVRGIMLGAIKG